MNTTGQLLSMKVSEFNYLKMFKCLCGLGGLYLNIKDEVLEP